MTEAQNPLTPDDAHRGGDPSGYSTNLDTPQCVLAIGAHPDDVDFGCGATLAKWAKAGARIHVVVCTDGSKGTWDPAADEAELIATRQREQRAAAKALGATGEVVFLGWTDGELYSGMVQRRQVVDVIRRTRPNVVVGHDPWKRYRLHPDHRHAGWLATDGVVAARDPKFFPELGPHHRPDLLLLWEADQPDHAEDVTGHMDAKYRALVSHHSQFESTMKSNDDPELTGFRSRVEAKAVEAAAGLSFEHGEVFKLIDDL